MRRKTRKDIANWRIKRSTSSSQTMSKRSVQQEIPGEEAFGSDCAWWTWRSHCRRGIQFIKSLQSCEQGYLHASSSETLQDAKAAVGKEWEKLENVPAWQMTEVKSKTEVIEEAQKEQRTVQFATLVDISSQEYRVGTQISEIQRPCCTPRWHSKRRLWLVCSSHRAGVVCTTYDERDSNGCQSKATRMCRTGSGRSICLHPSQNGRCSICFLKIPKSECPVIWIRQPRHKWPKSWSSMEDPVVPLERNLKGHPLAGLLWERRFWENPIEAWLGENFQSGMLIRTPWKRNILICECGCHRIGWKETKY